MSIDLHAECRLGWATVHRSMMQAGSKQALVLNRIYQNDKSSRDSINAWHFIVLIHLILIQLIAHDAATELQTEWCLFGVSMERLILTHTHACPHMSEWIMCRICFTVWELTLMLAGGGCFHPLVAPSTYTRTQANGQTHRRTRI